MSETEDTPAHERIEGMDDEQRQAFEEKRAELDAAVTDARLGEGEQEAFEMLAEPMDETETVVLNGDEVRVRVHLDGRLEDLFEEAAEAESAADARPELIEAMSLLVAEPDYTEAVFYMFADEYGVMELSKLFMTAVEPALELDDRLEELQRFRGDGFR